MAEQPNTLQQRKEARTCVRACVRVCVHAAAAALLPSFRPIFTALHVLLTAHVIFFFGFFFSSFPLPNFSYANLIKRSADEAGLFGTETPLDPFTFDNSSDEGTAAKRHQEDTDSKMEAARREYYELLIEHYESGKMPHYPFILKLHTPCLFMNHVKAECARFNGTVDLAHATEKIIEHDITGPKAVDMSKSDWREKLGMELSKVAQIIQYVRAAGEVSDSDKKLAALELAELQAAAKNRRERTTNVPQLKMTTPHKDDQASAAAHTYNPQFGTHADEFSIGNKSPSGQYLRYANLDNPTWLIGPLYDRLIPVYCPPPNQREPYTFGGMKRGFLFVSD